MRAVILGQGNPYVKNPYLSKLAEVLEKERIEFEFWVWFRGGGWQELPRVRALMSWGAWGGGVGSVVGYFFWMARLFLAVLFDHRRIIFFCSRFDAALPCALVSLAFPLKFVFLDRDKLSKSYSWPSALKRILEAVESFIERRAILHVVPGQSRLGEGGARANTRIVRNTPHSDVIERALAHKLRLPPRSGVMRVLISGLISAPRGAAMTLRAVESIDASKVEFIAAGRLVGPHAERLGRLLGDRFLGLVSNEEALAMIVNSDLVLAFYDPALEINRLAESNKWFDCAALGVPFVTNNGLLTSRQFSEAGACFVVNYDDHESLGSLLLKLADDREAIEEKRRLIAALKHKPWDVAMSEVVRECGFGSVPRDGEGV